MAGDKLKMKHSATLQLRIGLKVNRTQTATLPYCNTLWAIEEYQDKLRELKKLIVKN